MAVAVLKKYILIGGQLLLLTAIYYTGNAIAARTGLPVPGNVIGMLLLLALLVSGVVKLSYVREGADLLVRHMLFLFIPVAVGLMDVGALFYNHLLIFTVAIVLSSALPLWLVGYITELWRGRQK